MREREREKERLPSRKIYTQVIFSLQRMFKNKVCWCWTISREINELLMIRFDWLMGQRIKSKRVARRGGG